VGVGTFSVSAALLFLRFVSENFALKEAIEFTPHTAPQGANFPGKEYVLHFCGHVIMQWTRPPRGQPRLTRIKVRERSTGWAWSQSLRLLSVHTGR